MAHGKRSRCDRGRYPANGVLVLFAILPLTGTVAGVQTRHRYRPALGKRPGLGSGFHLQSPSWGGPEPISLCEERYRKATLDHFSWDPPEGLAVFPQRYFLCSKFWKSDPAGQKGPIFIYLGNEDDVTLYLNATGLMWENAPNFGALLVFVEHRYYGKSFPPGEHSNKQYLTTEQAIADYAELITELKTELEAKESPVIGFGGSYGGMIAAWMRMKYPHILDGAIAASAPIWTFLGEDPPVDPGFFAKIVTLDATPASGSSAACVPNVRTAWPTIVQLSSSPEGVSLIKKEMGICDSVNLDDSESIESLMEWVSSAFDMMAMGSYPYPSNYMTSGDGYLPAFPIREACNKFLATPMSGSNLLAGLGKAAGLLYNSSGEVACFDFNVDLNNATAEVLNAWTWQSCTEMVIPDSRDGVNDMFWNNTFDVEEDIDWCVKNVGVMPRPFWAKTQWGGRDIGTASNIVFSNGEYDPWRGGGITTSLSESLLAVIIKQGGHHVDLMFSHDGDSDSIRAARAFELENIAKWIAEARGRDAANVQKLDKGSFPSYKDVNSQLVY